MRCLNNILEDFYYRYAFYVQRYVYIFLFAPVVLTAVLSTGFFYINVNMWNDTEFVFSPSNGYSVYERRTFDEQFPLEQTSYVPGQSFEVKHHVYVIVTGKGLSNANLLSIDLLEEIERLNQFILDDLTVDSYDGLYRITYRNVCLSDESKCFENNHVALLSANLKYGDAFGVTEVRYPITRLLGGYAFHLGAVLGSVRYDPLDGRIIEIGALKLLYFMKHEPTNYKFYTIQFRDALTDYLLNRYKSKRLEIAFGTEQSISQGVHENTVRYMPAICVTVMLVLTFSYLCSFMFYRSSDSTYIDWVRSKPLLAVVGTIEPGLAVVSTVGLLLFFGCPFNDIVVVMPFLVFAIGVDDMFIMISAWHNTRFTDPPEKRFAEAMSDAAVAITITSMTDIIAFSVGTWNPFPGMQMFCYYTATAMLFELIYQCTFYSAALYLIGRAECRGLHCVTWKKVKSIEQSKTIFQKYFCIGTIMNSTNRRFQSDDGDIQVRERLQAEHQRETTGTTDHELSFVQSFFRNRYGPFLLKPVTKVFVALLFGIYLTLAIWGTIIMPSGLLPEKLVYKGHYVYNYLHSYSHWQNGMPLQILVNNPPDMFVYKNRLEFNKVIERLENSSYIMDRSFTLFWLEEYKLHLKLNSSDDSAEFRHDAVKSWIESSGSRNYWRSCIRWSNETDSKIAAFRFMISLKNYFGQKQQEEALVFVRNVLQAYPEYNMTCYQQRSAFVDQYLAIYPTTVRNTFVSLCIVIFVAVCLIPHPVCGLFMTFSVLSIDVGVSGFLCWWNVNMDCISMITIIIATGFAVDFSAHVSYGYVKAEGTANERAMKSLETLGWPVFQGVTATFLGVLVMGTVDAYIFSVFFKTVVLVILFGLMHSIVFLPVALTVFIPNTLNVCRNKSATSEKRPGVEPSSVCENGKN